MSLETKHVIDAATQDILDETLNAPRKEKPPGHVVVLIIFLRNAEARSVNVEAIRRQKRNLILRGTGIVIPGKLRSRVLALAHEGHPGIVSMRLKLLILLLQRMLSTQDQTIQTLRRIVEKQRLLHLQDLFVIRSCQRSLKTLI